MIKLKTFANLNQRNRAVVLPHLTSFTIGAEFYMEQSIMSKKTKIDERGRVEITSDLCKGCLLCIEACPPQVLKESESLNKMGYHPAIYIGEKCTACGICFYICPEPGAIRVYKREKSH
ncbi:MAG: ferredoxin family protein [bacterium]